jgi:MYXO-CTERM domain-containing protein
MRRISPAFALAAILLTPSAALASQHQMRVSEILLSSGGDDAVQYVELSDPGEPFPDGTYEIDVYDVDGALIDSQNIVIPASTTRRYIATAAADDVFGPDGDIELAIALPAEGQLCFERTNGAKIACTSWGCINTVVSGDYDTSEGAPPPDGMSLQRQADGTYEVGNPTPDATNVAGEAAPACATAPDAGPSEIDAGAGEPDGAPVGDDGGTSGGDGSGGDDDDSGCGCRVNGGGGAASCLALGAVSLLGAFRRRRRRRA